MEENKKFGDLKKGDIVYAFVDGSFEVLELKVMNICQESSYNTVLFTFNNHSIVRLSADWNDEYIHSFGDYERVYFYADELSLSDGIKKLKEIVDELAEKYCK